MSECRLRIGQLWYTIHAEDMEKVIDQVNNALNSQTVERIEVLDENNCGVSVFLNGGHVDAVSIESGRVPRPTEFGRPGT